MHVSDSCCLSYSFMPCVVGQHCWRAQADASGIMCSWLPMLCIVCRKRKEAAVAAHQQFHSKLGDHVSGLNLYRAYTGLPKYQQPSWCQEHFVSARSLHKAINIYQQLHQQLTMLGLPVTSAGPEVELVLKALVAGLFTNAARRQLDGNCAVCPLHLAPVNTSFP